MSMLTETAHSETTMTTATIAPALNAIDLLKLAIEADQKIMEFTRQLIMNTLNFASRLSLGVINAATVIAVIALVKKFVLKLIIILLQRGL